MAPFSRAKMTGPIKKCDKNIIVMMIEHCFEISFFMILGKMYLNTIGHVTCLNNIAMITTVLVYLSSAVTYLVRPSSIT